MKKSAILAMLTTLFIAAGSAHAEHKLLVTEVLDAKQMEAQATFEYLHSTRKVEEGAVTLGKARQNIWESNYSLNVGLGHGLEIDASIPYVFSERLKIAEEPTERRDGIGDFTFGAKYALYENKEKHCAVVIGTDVKFDTAGFNNAGTETTDVSPYIAASHKLNEHAIPYAIYRATLRNNGGEDTHDFALGLESELNETVTLDARFDAVHGTGTKLFKASENYRLELASYVQLHHNFYLIPAVAVATGSDVDVKGTDGRFTSPKGISGALSLYYLF